VVELPEVRFLTGAGERGYVHAAEGVSIPREQAKALDRAMREIAWQDLPFGSFEQSHDLFGDGSVVLVPMPGHTPGSLGTWVRLSEQEQVLHVGDIISLAESIHRRVPKSALVSALTDQDAPATREVLARIIEWRQRAPALTVLPAHDRTAWEQIFGARPVGETGPWCRDAGGGPDAAITLPAAHERGAQRRAEAPAPPPAVSAAGRPGTRTW
jgi:glyoxylase-like metal-dependent hydrolase (beta-lactamase superfamily II)